jgi:hypothetical protein
MENSPGKDLTLIIYDSPRPPKYLKVSKNFMWGLILFSPIAIAILLFSTLFTGYYAKSKIDNLKSYEPLTLQKLREEKETLQNKIFDLENINEELSEKISAGSSTPESTLDLIAQPLGFKNLTTKNLAKMDNFSLQKGSEKLTLKFDLINNTQDSSRLSGFIIIAQMTNKELSFYPDVKFTNQNLLIDYSTGESFYTSRFRPVIAEFKKPTSSSVRYRIFIFSRSGNLLANKITDPYQISNEAELPAGIQEGNQ